jgi:hypothetical protein
MRLLIKRLSLFFVLITLPAAMATLSLSADRIPLKKGNDFTIDSTSECVGEGELFIKKGDKPSTLKAEVLQTIKGNIISKKKCLFCAEIIHFEPNLKVPADLFNDKDSKDLKGFIVLKPLSLSEDIISKTFSFNKGIIQVPVRETSKEFLISGPQKATMQKKGRVFTLVSGQIFYEDSR